MKPKTTLTIFFALALIYSCKKNDTKNDTKKDAPAGQITKISGKIKFPAGLNLVPSGCSVNSFITDQTLSDENYTVDVDSNDFNIQFLTSSGGKELMLGYSYPSQTDFTIDSKSTLLALVMKLPVVNSLSTSGKLNLIDKIKISPGYADAINAIEAHIALNLDIFDTTDVNMQQKIGSLFDYAATHRQGFGYDGQVYVNKSGKAITFGNPGVSIAQVIGIYQGSNRIAKLELDRYKTFVTSIAEIPSAINNPPQPIEVKYDFQNDGVYQIKVRSGGFNLPNNDLESNEALISNASNFVLDNLKVFIPIDLSKECPEAVFNAIKSQVDIFKIFLKGSANISAFLGIGYNLTKTVINSILVNSTCVSGVGKIRYLDKVLKYLKWLDLVGKVGTSINNSIFLTDYFLATKSSLDTTIAIGITIPILKGTTYSLISWRYGAPVPGSINFCAPAAAPCYIYKGKDSLIFNTESTWSENIYDSLNNWSRSLGGSYSIGSYSADSVFIRTANDTYGHQYPEGWGIKLPPGFRLDLNVGGYFVISSDGRYIYQIDDAVYKK
jgi:hypothetical protein